jgi:hypothetical protein
MPVLGLLATRLCSSGACFFDAPDFFSLWPTAGAGDWAQAFPCWFEQQQLASLDYSLWLLFGSSSEVVCWFNVPI